MKAKISAVFLFLLLIPMSQACLETWEVLAWHDIELQLNISNSTLVNLAEEQCVRSEMSGNVTGQLDNLEDKIENLRNSIDYEHIDLKVDQRMGNWTEYMEREAGLGQIRMILSAIYNETITESNLTENYVTVEKLGEEISELKRDIRDDTSAPATFTAAGPDYTMVFALGFAGVLVLVYFLSTGKGKQIRNIIMPSSQPQPANPTIRTGLPMLGDEKDDLNRAKKQRLKDIMIAKLEKKLATTKDDKEEQKVRKQIEELIEED